MDILRTDSPVTGFDFPSSSLTRPSPYWVRALSTPVPEYTEDFDELEWEAEAELHSLVHQLSFSDMRDCKRVSSSSSFQSRASSSSSADSLSTIGYTSYTTSTSTLHTPSSSVDYQYSTRSIAKSRSFASLSLAPSARREAVYIVDDDDTEPSDDADHYRTADALADEPPSRFSIDEDVQSRPFRDIWTRSRAISMSSPRPSIPNSPALSAYPFPSMPAAPPARTYTPAPPPSPTAHKKSKRKTVLSILNMGMFNF